MMKIQIHVWTYGRDQILGSWSPMRRKVHSEQLKRSVRWNQCLNSWPGSNPWILEPNRWTVERTIKIFKSTVSKKTEYLMNILIRVWTYGRNQIQGP